MIKNFTRVLKFVKKKKNQMKILELRKIVSEKNS